MAGFKVHFVTAAWVGGLAATAILVAGVTDAATVAMGFVAVILGGLAPDIDADNSLLLHAVFSLAAVVVAFLVLFALASRYAILELVLIWLGVYLLIKLVVYRMVMALTVHRGIFHSIPAGVVFGLAVVLLLFFLFGVNRRSTWLVGGFAWVGYLTHLVLDEIYSLNIFGAGPRNSLGSACKFHTASLMATLMAYLLIGVGVYLVPPVDGVWDQLTRPAVWQTIRQRWMPVHGWFGLSQLESIHDPMAWAQPNNAIG